MKASLLLVGAVTTVLLIIFALAGHVSLPALESPTTVTKLTSSSTTTAFGKQKRPPAGIQPDDNTATAAAAADTTSTAGTSAHQCILYDRPLRTGSTTISKTLERCLEGKGYYVLPQSGRNITRENVASQFIKSRSKSTKRASLLKHLYVTVDDMAAMRASCDSFFYISSCSPMVSRLLSMIKYSTFEGHGNASVDAETFKTEVLRRKKNLSVREAFLEMYPYTTADVKEEDRLVPDYVIRQSHLASDLRTLLDAMKCEHIDIESMNVHDVDFEEVGADGGGKQEEGDMITDVLEHAKDYMMMGDNRYLRMLQVAQNFNKKGLKLVRQF